MQIPSLLLKIQIHLIAGKNAMTTIAYTDSRTVHLIAIANCHAVKFSSKKESHGIRRAVRHSRIEHFLLFLVLYTSGHIHTIRDTIISSNDRR